MKYNETDPTEATKIINAAIKIVILNPSLCHSERSEESRRYARDRLHEGVRNNREKGRFFALFRITTWKCLVAGLIFLICVRFVLMLLEYEF